MDYIAVNQLCRGRVARHLCTVRHQACDPMAGLSEFSRLPVPSEDNLLFHHRREGVHFQRLIPLAG